MSSDTDYVWEGDPPLQMFELLSRAVDQSASSVLITDREGRIVYVNAQFEKTSGYFFPEVKGLKPSILKSGRVPQEVYVQMWECVLGGEQWQGELINRKKNGELYCERVVLSALRDFRGEITHFLSVKEDITRQKFLEKENKSLSKRYLSLLNAVPEIVMETDFSGVYIFANRQGIDFFGEDVIGKNVEDFMQDPEEALSRLEPLFSGNVSFLELESWQKRRDGEFRLLFWRCVTLYDEEKQRLSGFLSSASDITDTYQAAKKRHDLESQLRRLQRLQTISNLAGGIAHDFNNILTPVLSYTDMAMEQLDPSGPVYKDLSKVIEAVKRARDLTSQILLFARGVESEGSGILEVRKVIESCQDLLKSSLVQGVSLNFSFCEEPVFVKISKSELSQVVINLGLNGILAMKNKGGVLKIHLFKRFLEIEEIFLYPGLSPGRYAVIEVIDSGIGMDPSTMERIFDPFFTTRKVGEGSGLGLSVVHGIISGCKGAIFVSSNLGEGSCFSVYLPEFQI